MTSFVFKAYFSDFWRKCGESFRVNKEYKTDLFKKLQPGCRQFIVSVTKRKGPASL